jgi:hypothetical protein
MRPTEARVAVPRNQRVYPGFDRRLAKLVGRILAQLRTERQLSLIQAGILGGFYPCNLSKHERGTWPISVSRLRMYLAAYGVSWEEFGERLHRLDVIWPREISHEELNRLRREREAQHVNRFTGRRPITCRANPHPPAIAALPTNRGVAMLHDCCRRQIRRTPRGWSAA